MIVGEVIDMPKTVSPQTVKDFSAMAIEIDYIKTAIDDLKTVVNKFIEKQTEKNDEAGNVRQALLLHCKDCERNRDDYYSKLRAADLEIKNLKIELTELKKGPRKSLYFWVTIMSGLAAVGLFVISLIK
jgi:hypothetical protein